MSAPEERCPSRTFRSASGSMARLTVGILCSAPHAMRVASSTLHNLIAPLTSANLLETRLLSIPKRALQSTEFCRLRSTRCRSCYFSRAKLRCSHLWSEWSGSPTRDHHLAQDRSLELPIAGCLSNRSEEHTSELQSPCNLVCRLLLE